MVRYRAVLFDLFGTLVDFDAARLPEIDVDGRRLRSTLGALQPLVDALVPGVALADVWQALTTVGEELARARSWDHVELPSRERFRRTLVRLGCDDAVVDEGAVVLSRAHMRAIADATVFPVAHAELLRAVAARVPVAVVSNFDDTATAYAILQRHGIAAHAATVVVSEAFGLRKPHPALLRVPLRELGVGAAEAVFVGDAFAEDVGVAHAAGVDAAWIDRQGQGVPPAAPRPPRYVVRTLPELAPTLLAG